MVLGTNVLMEFGMETVYTDGSAVKPSGMDTTGCGVSSTSGSVFLVRAVYMAPGQSRTVYVSAIPIDKCMNDIGVLAPSENMANSL